MGLMLQGTSRLGKCVCGGDVWWEQMLVEIEGRSFGHQSVGVCDDCQARYLQDHVVDAIERQL
ncbi:hypothetical protein HZB01_00430 [Candidatus Woesearchaeota archaeon]|nr:hypothetical protein [Candidatus Woesearchaeota archaeon]